MNMAEKTADELAFDEMRVLLEHAPGTLKIITSEVAPHMRLDRKDANSPVNPDKVQAIIDDADDPRTTDADVRASPSTFGCQDVVRLEADPAKAGAYRAYSAEGDWTLGYPSALLNRLRQWRGR